MRVQIISSVLKISQFKKYNTIIYPEHHRHKVKKESQSGLVYRISCIVVFLILKTLTLHKMVFKLDLFVLYNLNREIEKNHFITLCLNLKYLKFKYLFKNTG